VTSIIQPGEGGADDSVGINWKGRQVVGMLYCCCTAVAPVAAVAVAVPDAAVLDVRCVHAAHHRRVLRTRANVED